MGSLVSYVFSLVVSFFSAFQSMNLVSGLSVFEAILLSLIILAIIDVVRRLAHD